MLHRGRMRLQHGISCGCMGKPGIIPRFQSIGGGERWWCWAVAQGLPGPRATCGSATKIPSRQVFQEFSQEDFSVASNFGKMGVPKGGEGGISFEHHDFELQSCLVLMLCKICFEIGRCRQWPDKVCDDLACLSWLPPYPTRHICPKCVADGEKRWR